MVFNTTCFDLYRSSVGLLCNAIFLVLYVYDSYWYCGVYTSLWYLSIGCFYMFVFCFWLCVCIVSRTGFLLTVWLSLSVCFFADVVYVEVFLVFKCCPLLSAICPLYIMLCHLYGLSPICFVRIVGLDSVLLTEGSILGPCYKIWELLRY